MNNRNVNTVDVLNFYNDAGSTTACIHTIYDEQLEYLHIYVESEEEVNVPGQVCEFFNQVDIQCE